MCRFVKRLVMSVMVVVVGSLLVVKGRRVEMKDLQCGMTCKEPQPRAIRMATLVDTHLRVVPYMTVIHRCDEGSGCCLEKGKICTMANFENLTIEYHVLVNKKFRPQSCHVTNHTQCSCQSADDDIK